MEDKLNVVIEKVVKNRIEELNHDTEYLMKEFNRLTKEEAQPRSSNMELERKKENTLKRISLNKSVVSELLLVNLNYSEDLKAYLSVIKTTHQRVVTLTETFPEGNTLFIEDYFTYIKSKAILYNINHINVQVSHAMEGKGMSELVKDEIIVALERKYDRQEKFLNKFDDIDQDKFTDHEFRILEKGMHLGSMSAYEMAIITVERKFKEEKGND